MRLGILSIVGTVLLAVAWMPDSAMAGGESPETAAYSPQQLEQMLAPIALYPDTLLDQILAAATYPVDVIEAYRWVSQPENAALEGDALTAALETKDWDPSVKALVPFPQILKIMNNKLDWMRRLGDAYLLQKDDVMAAVQRLRAQAATAGNLSSGERVTVVHRDDGIVIEPPGPALMYVPVYDPFFAFGTWPWPAFPPVVFTSFGVHFIEPGFFTFVSFPTVTFIRIVTIFHVHHRHFFVPRHRHRFVQVHEPAHDTPTVVPDPRINRVPRSSNITFADTAQRQATASTTTTAQPSSAIITRLQQRHLAPRETISSFAPRSASSIPSSHSAATPAWSHAAMATSVHALPAATEFTATHSRVISNQRVFTQSLAMHSDPPVNSFAPVPADAPNTRTPAMQSRASAAARAVMHRQPARHGNRGLFRARVP